MKRKHRLIDRIKSGESTFRDAQDVEKIISTMEDVAEFSEPVKWYRDVARLRQLNKQLDEEVENGDYQDDDIEKDTK